MINKKILVIAPYPIAKPRHGGQKRTKALVDLYENNFSEVRFVAVFHKASYPDFAPTDIPLGQIDNLEKIDANPYALDQIVGRSIDNDSHVRSQFAHMLQGYKPDIIHVEQPFLYEGLSILLRELDLHPRLIFGSQNIEHTLKANIYQAQKIHSTYAQELMHETEQIEREFSRVATLVIAVSAEDAAEHKKMGAKRIAIAPNGIDKMYPTAKSLNKWKKLKAERNIDNLITFIGSGHPPNYLGVIEMIGMDTSFLPPRTLFVLGGGVSEYFKATYHYKKTKKYENFWKNIEPTGHLSEEDLAGLLDSSDVMLLPITSGGGSNLKTAEAILSGKKVVATRYAFRGFEKYLDLPNIYLADRPVEFKRAIANAIDSQYIERSAEEQALANSVQWQECLLPALPALRRVARAATLDHYTRAAQRRTRRIKGAAKRLLKG